MDFKQLFYVLSVGEMLYTVMLLYPQHIFRGRVYFKECISKSVPMKKVALVYSVRKASSLDY